MPEIKVTERNDLTDLMAYEFHKDNQTSFDDAEAQNYINRLTDAQINLLKSSRVKANQLTAFIVFGDGFIKREMGATFVSDHIMCEDAIRPNSSLAFFYKHNEDKIELAFYTRFVVANYSSGNKYGIEVRKACHKLHKKQNIEENEKRVFKNMHELNSVKFLDPVTQIPPHKHTYYFFTKTIDGGHYETAGPKTPFISVLDAAGKNAPFIGPKNTLHGAIDTKGCWMIFRNYLWEYPRENLGDIYNYLAELYIYSEVLGYDVYPIPGIPHRTTVKEKVEDILGRPVSMMEFKEIPRNYSYYRFLRTFAGIRYNYSHYIKFPKEIKHAVVADIGNLPSSFRVDAAEDLINFYFWKGEHIKFINSPVAGEERMVLGCSPGNRYLFLDHGLSQTPPDGAEFVVLDNAWYSPTNTKCPWGPNIFGQMFDYNKPWATVFGFKRTDERFTEDSGDTDPFQ